MWAHMTTGTLQFLQRIIDKHPEFDFHVMKRPGTTVVYYESHKRKSIFVSGRTYRILYNHRPIKRRGFVVINTIPITSDGLDSFQHRAERIVTKFELVQGIAAVRLLRQHKKNSFVLLTQWDNEKMYNQWRESSEYVEMNLVDLARLPAYFADRPHSSHYVMVVDDEKEDYFEA